MSLLQKLAGLASGIEHGIAGAVHPQQQQQQAQQPHQLQQLAQLMPHAQMLNAQGQPQWRPGDGGAPQVHPEQYATLQNLSNEFNFNRGIPQQPMYMPNNQQSMEAINTGIQGGLGGPSNGQYVPYDTIMPPYLQQRR